MKQFKMIIRGRKVGFNNAFNFALGVVERILSYRYFNLWKTFYVNFRCLPFFQAIKFPVVVWGGLKVTSLMGKIKINVPITYGMIRLGDKSHMELVSCGKQQLYLDGEITFNGNFKVFNGFHIQVMQNAKVVFGKEFCANANFNLIAIGDVSIGDETRCAYNVKIMSSDVHYSIDTEQRLIYRNVAPILIGRNNWLTSDVKVMKGTITPDWTIVTAGSFLNKDYTKIISEGSIIGGSPAKLIKVGQKRVFSLDNEDFLNRFFTVNSHEIKYFLPEDVDVNHFCHR